MKLKVKIDFLINDKISGKFDLHGHYVINQS